MMPAADVTPGSSSSESPDLGLLFHRLNNQLGIILANAELLEAKLKDEIEPRARDARSSRASSTRWRPPARSASDPLTRQSDPAFRASAKTSDPIVVNVRQSLDRCLARQSLTADRPCTLLPESSRQCHR